MLLGETIRVGEEAWGVPLEHGKGRAVSSGKWEGARGAGREAPVARGSEPLPKRRGVSDSAANSPSSLPGLAHSAAAVSQAVSWVPNPNPVPLEVRFCSGTSGVRV